MGKEKMTKLEKQWVLYDVGNSAFVMLVSTIIPIYFKNMATASGISAANSTAYLSYAISISTILVALLGPVCGAAADNKGFKKPLFTAWRNRLCSHGNSENLAGISGGICHCKSGIFRQPDFL